MENECQNYGRYRISNSLAVTEEVRLPGAVAGAMTPMCAHNMYCYWCTQSTAGLPLVPLTMQLNFYLLYLLLQNSH